MFRIYATIILGILFVISLSSCKTDRTSGPVEREVRNLTTVEAQISASGNRFGFELFQQVNRAEPGKNFFISPLSIAMALGMALNGADQATLAEMKTVLGLQKLNDDEINSSYKSLNDLLTQMDAQVVFEIANSLWYRQEFTVAPVFIDQLKRFFSAQASGLNFNSPEAAKIINQWVEQKTHGKIKGIVDVIPPEIMLYLINAIYFKGTWTYAFDPLTTLEAPFYLADNSTMSCQMMSQTATLPFMETDAMQAVDLPYGAGAFGMTILLPRSTGDLEALCAQLTQENWQQWSKMFREQKGTIFLPRFELQYAITLNQVLQQMGMNQAFNPEAADFSRINKNEKLFISQVKHKTFLKVDEEGTEAAAVTSIEVGVTSVGGPQGFFMRIDRPFLLVIHERNSQSLLFIGKVHRPE